MVSMQGMQHMKQESGVQAYGEIWEQVKTMHPTGCSNAPFGATSTTERGTFSLVARSLRSLRVLRLRRARYYDRKGMCRHTGGTWHPKCRLHGLKAPSV